MKPIHVRNLAIAIGVAVTVALGMSLLMSLAGAKFAPNIAFAPAVFLGGLTFYVLWNLSGNRKVARASEAQREEALSLIPPPGQALLYIVRQGFVAKAAGMDIVLDGSLRAQLKAPQFTCFAVAPGPHELSAAFSGGAGAQSRSQTEPLMLEAGQAIGILALPQMGMVKNSIAFETLRGQQLQQTIRGMTMVLPIEASPARDDATSPLSAR